MYRIINQTSSSTEIKKCEILINNILDGLYSLALNYSFLLDEKEKSIIKSTINLIEKYNTKKGMLLKEDKIKELTSFISTEEKLKGTIAKCWKYEANNGNMIISWLKEDKTIENKEIISSTLNTSDIINNFCNSQIGIEYEFSVDSFLGASPKDAAVIQEKNTPSIYTIGVLPNGIINSYSMATTIITPIQLLNSKDYCEIILSGKQAIPKSIIYLNDIYLNLAYKLSEHYHIPLRKISISHKDIH